MRIRLSRVATCCLFGALVLPWLVACMPQKRDPAEETRKLLAAFEETLAEAETTVARTLPAERFVRTDLIPGSMELVRPPAFDAVSTLRVAVPERWDAVRVFWAVGEALGYFESAGLRLAWQTVADDAAGLAALREGSVDLALAGQASSLVRKLWSDPDSAGQLVAVSAVFRKNTDVFLSLDERVDRSEPSYLEPPARDLWGRILGAQDRRSWELQLFLDQNGIPRHRVKLVRVGWNPVNLLNNRAHWMTANGFVHPEELEHRGVYNWIELPYEFTVHPDHGLLTVTGWDRTGDQADRIRRYHWALRRSVNYTLGFPLRAARILKESIKVRLPDARLARRIELMAPYVRGNDGAHILRIEIPAIDAMTARLLVAGQLTPDDPPGR